MFQHPFEPFWVQTARPRLKRHLVLQAAHYPCTAGLIADEHGRIAAFCAFYRTRNAAQRVEIVINRGDTQFDRFKVLIGQINIAQSSLKEACVFPGLPIAAIGKTFACLVSIGQFILFAPCTTIDQCVNIRPIGTFSIREHAQGGVFDIAPHFVRIIEGMGADEIFFATLIRSCGLVGSFGQHPCLQRKEIAEDAR